MGILQQFRRTKASSAPNTEPTTSSATFYMLFASNAVLAALSITNVALINSVAGWSLDQKQNVRNFQIQWSGSATPLNVEPRRLWLGQAHESDAAGCYGFLLGVFGMVTAWRARNAGRALRSLTALAVLQLVALVFTASAFLFVFIVTYHTTGRRIREPVASNNLGVDYPEFTWTLETWMKAVLDLPLIDGSKRTEIDSKVTEMVAWRWILVPILAVNCVAFGVTLQAWLKQRRSQTTRVSSAGSNEK